MTMKAEIKACLTAHLENLLDDYMEENGFIRNSNSLNYKRIIGESEQLIKMPIEIHPKDNSSASAAIYPRMEVHIDSVDRILDDMIDGNLGLLEGVTNGRSNQPIGFTSEKADPGRWYVYQSESVYDIVEEMRIFLERWTLPFLDVYTTASDVLATDERNDARMVRDRAHMMRVVAAALVCNRREYAQAVMKKYLGATFVRHRYQQVYDYIRKMPD